jgi:hypothetical protein
MTDPVLFDDAHILPTPGKKIGYGRSDQSTAYNYYVVFLLVHRFNQSKLTIYRLSLFSISREKQTEPSGKLALAFIWKSI